MPDVCDFLFEWLALISSMSQDVNEWVTVAWVVKKKFKSAEC